MVPPQKTALASKPLTSAQERAVESIARGRRFVLSGHMRPDGDCIGAQAALALGLESLGKEVWILNPDPPEPQFDYLTRRCTYRSWKGGDLPAHDVSILLDAAELERCGELGEALRAAKSRKLVIDHHVHEGAEWWDEAFVDVTASATGLLVWRVLGALGVEPNRGIAEGVFTSIVTDTGWFKYSNSDAETLAVAAELVAFGVEPHTLYSAIFQRHGSQHPAGVARALSSLEYFGDGRLAVVTIPPPGPGEVDLHDGDVVLDLLRSVERVEVVLLLRTTKDGKSKLSARSKTEFDVNRLAGRFGGGGHVRAAGATLAMSLADAKAALVASALEDLAGADRSRAAGG